jgi:hypothetical protein
MDSRRPILDKVRLDDGTEYWSLDVERAPSIRFEIADRAGAQAAWTAATWAYNNGADDVRKAIKYTLGIE